MLIVTFYQMSNFAREPLVLKVFSLHSRSIHLYEKKGAKIWPMFNTDGH